MLGGLTSAGCLTQEESSNSLGWSQSAQWDSVTPATLLTSDGCGTGGVECGSPAPYSAVAVYCRGTICSGKKEIGVNAFPAINTSHLFLVFPVFSLPWLSPALCSSLLPLSLRSSYSPEVLPHLHSDPMASAVPFSQVQISGPALAFKPGSPLSMNVLQAPSSALASSVTSRYSHHHGPALSPLLAPMLLPLVSGLPLPSLRCCWNLSSRFPFPPLFP